MMYPEAVYLCVPPAASVAVLINLRSRPHHSWSLLSLVSTFDSTFDFSQRLDVHVASWLTMTLTLINTLAGTRPILISESPRQTSTRTPTTLDRTSFQLAQVPLLMQTTEATETSHQTTHMDTTQHLVEMPLNGHTPESQCTMKNLMYHQCPLKSE